MAPTATAYRVFNRGNTGFCVGQIVGVVGGLPADMVNVMQPTSDPLPPGSFMIDAARAAREAAESAAAFQATSKPDRLLTSEELQEKVPAFRDPQLFALAVTQHGFDAHQPMSAGVFRRFAGDRFSEKRTDRWLASKRAERDALDTLCHRRGDDYQ